MPRKSSTKEVSFETVTPWASFDLAMKGVLLKWGTLDAGNEHGERENETLKTGTNLTKNWK